MLELNKENILQQLQSWMLVKIEIFYWVDYQAKNKSVSISVAIEPAFPTFFLHANSDLFIIIQLFSGLWTPSQVNKIHKNI